MKLEMCKRDCITKYQWPHCDTSYVKCHTHASKPIVSDFKIANEKGEALLLLTSIHHVSCMSMNARRSARPFQ